MKRWLCHFRIIDRGMIVEDYPAIAQTEGACWTIGDKQGWEISEGRKAQEKRKNGTACAQCYSIVEFL